MFILKIFRPLVKRAITKQQDEIVDYINKKIDLPNMDEKKEEEIMDQIYDTLEAIILNYIL